MKKEYKMPLLNINVKPEDKLCTEDWNVVSGVLDGTADKDSF